MNGFFFFASNCLRRVRFAPAFVSFLLLLVGGASTGYAQDSPSGFFPANIHIFAGNGTGNYGNGPATDAGIGAPTAVAEDSQGNLFIANGAEVFMVYAGGTVPPILAAVTTQATPSVTPVAGDIYAVAGGGGPSSDPDADVPAASAYFLEIQGMWLDANDNLYIADFEAYTVVEIDHATAHANVIAGQFGQESSYTGAMGNAAINGASPTGVQLGEVTDVKTDSYGNIYIADLYPGAAVYVIYAGTQAPPVLAVEGVMSPVKGKIYVIAGVVADSCTLSTCAANGAATTTPLFRPRGIFVDGAGNVYVLDYSEDLLRIVYVSEVNGAVPPALVAAGYAHPTPGNLYLIAGTYSATARVACTAANCGDGGLATAAAFKFPYKVLVDPAGNVYIADAEDNAVRKIDTSGYIASIAGTANPNGVEPSAPTGSGGPATSAELYRPSDIAFNSSLTELYIGDGNEVVWQVAAALPQTIDFPTLTTPVSYGTNPTLNATASSGLDVYYAVSGPASIICPGGASPTQSTSAFDPSAVTCTGNSANAQLKITGPGTVTVTASQPGGTDGAGTYAPATAAAGTLLTQAITVQPLLLTVTANSLFVTYGQFNPSAPGFYSATYNFVNGDTAATVFKGQPAISASQPNGTPVTAASPQGTYPINVTQGTMALINSNYLLTSSSFISGTLTITGNKPQTISFPALTPLVYGQKSSVALTATASSGGPVTYTVVSGPGTVTGSTLNVTGAGTIKITANQLGYGQYEAAPPVTQDLVVSPAPLTVTAPSSSYPYGTNISTALATASPIITGWVVASDATKVTCNACLTTTATSTSNPGSYAISVTPTALTLGSSIAANYTFQSFVPGTVTITKGTQTITFATLPTVITYGDQVILTAKSSSGLPVTLTLTGPGYFSNPGSTIRLGSIFLTNPTSGMAAYGATGTGPIVITASQAGNADYGAAPSVIQSQTVKPATLIVQANNTTREYGAPNPTFDYVFVPSAESGVGFQNGDSDIPSVITGLPTLTTTATSTSPAGTYPIVITQGTLAALPLSSPNYTFQFVNGTLTVLPAGSYTMTTNPSSLTIARGHSAQSTITITPLNLYQGTVTLSCGPLPANVSCTVSPSTYTFPGNQTGGNPSENPALGTITVNTTAATVVGALPADKSNLRLAGLLIPGALGGLFLLFARKRAAKAAGVWSLCALLSIGFGVFSITSCGGKSGLATAAPGTITITIGASGTTPSGSGAVTATVPLTVTIQ